jgi:hypothetical protein
MADAAAHDPIFHSIFSGTPESSRGGPFRRANYYRLTVIGGVTATFLLAVLAQPPAIADLASSLRLIFCICFTLVERLVN